MLKNIFVTLVFIASPVYAEELNEFVNGSVADADAINENFQNLNDRISTIEEAAGGDSGCSATQDGSNVVITCADGTSGILASEGTVIVLGEGVVGQQQDSYNTGDIVVMDANDVTIAKWEGYLSNDYWQVSVQTDPLVFARLRDNVFYGTERQDDLYFTTSDCTGPAFFKYGLGGYAVNQDPTSGQDWWIEANGERQDGLLIKSIKTPNCYQTSNVMNSLYQVVPYEMPINVRNAAPPFRLEQLP